MTCLSWIKQWSLHVILQMFYDKRLDTLPMLVRSQFPQAAVDLRLSAMIASCLGLDPILALLIEWNL